MTLDKKFLDDPIKFLRENPYGFLDGNNESATYDFTWKPTLEELVKSIYETLYSCSSDEDIEHLDEAWLGSLQIAKDKVEKGQTQQALALLLDLWPGAFGEQSGISWWGTFEDLKFSDGMWAQLVRSSFRQIDDSRPLEATEEINFAHYVTCEPFEWEGTP